MHYFISYLIFYFVFSVFLVTTAMHLQVLQNKYGLCGGFKENKEVLALTNHLGMPANRNEPLVEYVDAKAKKSH